MKIGIFGGTFNPIHNGHVALIERIKASLALDRVLVIPTALPPHKDAPDLAGGEHRLNMCRLAVAGLEGVSVDPLEIERGGKSYSIDTVRALRTKYRDDELYLLVGGDSFFSIRAWRDSEELLRLAVLVGIAREPQQEEELVTFSTELNESGARTCIVGGYEPVVASSTTVRAGDLSNVPQSVADYIVQNGLYGQECDIPVDLDALTAYLREHLSQKRFTHTLNVASEAIRLAKKHGGNEHLAYIAGLLHDICKELPKPEQFELIPDCAEKTDPTFIGSPSVWHGYAAVTVAARDYGVKNLDVLNAVRYHTTGRAGMSLLEEIVYLADLVCAGRDFPGVEALRAKAYRSIPAALLESFEFALDDLVRGDKPILLHTVAAYNQYLLDPAAREDDAPDASKQEETK